MDKIVDDFIATNCEEQLMKNEEYIQLQKEMNDCFKNNDINLYSELSIRMQIIVAKISYKKAVKDLLYLTSE